MSFLRRHLAVLALAMTMALACSAASASAAVCLGGGAGGSSIDAADCCPPGSHPGQMCPMHKRHSSPGGPTTLDHKAPAFCGCRSVSPAGILSIGVLTDALLLPTPVVRVIVAEILSDAPVDPLTVPTSPPPRA